MRPNKPSADKPSEGKADTLSISKDRSGSSESAPRARWVEMGKGLFWGLALLLSVASVSWWSLGEIEEKTRRDLEDTLSTVLNTTHEALHIWARERKADISTWIDTPKIRQSIEALTHSEQSSREVLLASPKLSELRALFQKALNREGYLGFAIIDVKGITLAATEDALIGRQHLLDRKTGYLQRALKGETLISLPALADVLLPNTFGEYTKGQPTMFVVGPVRNSGGQVIAALALRINPHKDFTRIPQLGRVGQSGETYAFDEKSKLLTESRFEQHLIQTGLIRPGERAILSVDIRDPGGNLVDGYHPNIDREQQPLTWMAASAIDGDTSAHMMGYRDYRGVPVVGVWLWDAELGLGLATEMDIEEAFASFRSTRWLVLNTLAVILLSFLAFSIAQTRGRAQALKLAYQIRERENQISVVLDNVVDAILTLNADDRIESFNNAAETIFGYPDSEVIGNPFQTLLARRDPIEEEDDPELLIDFDKLKKQKNLQGVRRDGSLFPMELNYSQVVLENRGLTIVIVRDIHERQRAEWELQTARDELENRVQERTADLENALKAIEAEIKKRESFENELQGSNAFLSSVLGSPTDISIVSTDLNGKIQYWNQGAENLLGYTADEMVGKQTMEILYPEDGDSRKIAADRAMDVVKTKRSSSFEVEEITREGKRIWAQLTLSPRFNEQGDIIGILGIGGNITNLKQTEAALKKQSTYLQMLEDIAHTSSQASTPDKALQTCLDQVCAGLDWPMANLFLPAEDASGDLVCSPIHHNREPALLRNFRNLTEVTRFARGEDLPGRVLQTAAPFWMSQVEEDINPARAREAKRAEIQSGFGFPILMGSEVLGVLEFVSPRLREQENELFEVMAQVGHQMGRILNRKQADRVLSRTREFMGLYQGLAEAAYRSVSLEESLQATLDHLCTVHNWPVGHLLKPDPDRPGELTSTGLWHFEDQEETKNFRKVSESLPLLLGVGFPGEVAESKSALWLNDLDTQRGFERARLAKNLGLISAWAFPLIHQNRLWGVFECFGNTQAKPDHEFLEGMQDVSALIGQLIALRHHEAEFSNERAHQQAVIDHAPVGILTLKADGTLTSFNPAAEFLFGYAAKEVIGQNVSFVLPEAYSGGQSAWMNQATLQSNPLQASPQRATVGLRKNGTPIQLSLAISQTQVEEDALFILTLHYVAQASMQSERTTSAQLQAPESPSIAADQPLNLARPQKRFPLADQLTEVGNQTINVAHDFNSPVFGVRKLIEHLRSLIPLSDHQKSLFDLLERKSKRIGDGIRSLKEFYRPQSGMGGPLNINEVLEDILTLNQQSLRNRKIKLEKHYADNLPQIDAVSDQIHQALQNLIQHSEASLPNGNGEIMIATEEEREHIKVYILDNGPPMAPGYLESQFSPMTGNSQDPNVASNLNLQLSINIVQTHGGSIEIAEREESGNVYTVTLPIHGTG